MKVCDKDMQSSEAAFSDNRSIPDEINISDNRGVSDDVNILDNRSISDSESASSYRNASDSKNIILIGMPGAGKSTVGVVLAKMLNYEFIDVDLVIQQRMQKTLQQLIDNLGTEGFITLEGEILAGLSPQRAIVSTGGSAIYSRDAIEGLAAAGHVIYLQIALDALRERLGDLDERGVVIKDNCKEDEADVLAALFAERVPLYEDAAEFTVCVDDLSISDAARAIRDAISQAGQ